MEFKAIVDAKARTRRGLRRGGSLRGRRTWHGGPPDRRTIGRTDRQTARRRRFLRKARRRSAAAGAGRSGGCARAVDRPGNPRRLSAANNTARPCNPRFRRSPRPERATRSCTLPWSKSPISTCNIARASSRKCSAPQLYKIPDLKTAAKPKAPRLSSLSVAVADARARESGGGGPAHRRGARQRARPVARSCQSAAQCVHPDLSGNPRAELGQGLPSIKTKVLDESGIKALKMGAFLAVTQGSDQPPRLIVCEYRGGKKTQRRSVWSARALPSIRAESR